MNSILLSSILSGLCLTSFSSTANDKVETVYNSAKFQQICKEKTQGAQVSFAYRGIIWNGTCEPLFFSSSRKSNIKGNEAELNSICPQSCKYKICKYLRSRNPREMCTWFLPTSPKII